MRTPMHLLCGIVVVALSGCATSASASPTVSGTEASEPPTSTSTPSATGTSSVGPSPSASDEVGGLADLTGAELFLASGIATEIRQSCERATDLPDGATAGLQCHPEGIAAIGFYLFNDRATMRDWYVARLAEFGVDLESGQVCRDGSPGEGADNPGDPEFVNRLGCYIDGSGAANVRMAFPAVAADRSVYVGAASDSGSIDELMTSLFPAQEPGATGCNFCIASIWSAARSD